jgi:hypothetical protein
MCLGISNCFSRSYYHAFCVLRDYSTRILQFTSASDLPKKLVSLQREFVLRNEIIWTLSSGPCGVMALTQIDLRNYLMLPWPYSCYSIAVITCRDEDRFCVCPFLFLQSAVGQFQQNLNKDWKLKCLKIMCNIVLIVFLTLNLQIFIF